MPQSSPALHTNPSLAAIILVIRTKAGPRLVFHYPPSPSPAAGSTSLDPAWYGYPSNQAEPSDESSDDWSSNSDGWASDDDATEGSRTGSRASGGWGNRLEIGPGGSLRSNKTRSAFGGSVRGSVDDEVFEGSRRGDGDRDRGSRGREESERRKRDTDDWESILGYGADGLSKLLSPGRAFHKRRFEVGIDKLVFVGAPRFVREDGHWRKKRRRPSNRRDLRSGEQTPTARPRADSADMDYVHIDEGIGVTSDESTNEHGHLARRHSTRSDGVASAVGSDAATSTGSASTSDVDSDLTMFNLVFVLNPTALEYHKRVSEMYDNVAKKFAKALKYEQAHRNYVYKESHLILTMKDKAREQQVPSFILWPNILRQSALAKAIAITFDAISGNKIAHINLSTHFDIAFQIPPPPSTPFLPTSFEPQMPGLWLTTANVLDDDHSETGLSPHSAILLLEDYDQLLKEVQSDNKELAGHLSHFIRNLTPTKSLQKLAKINSMSLKDTQFLAKHLIYWRRARAIPPLRRQDTYIVSPLADFGKLAEAIPNFEAQFPTLPRLPTILHKLSGIPKPYMAHAPSKDHRAAYMDILAWLMRGGWVTQLRTFAWIKVPPETKAAVAAQMHEERKKSNASEMRRRRASSGVDIDYTGGSDHESITSSTIQRSPQSKTSVISETLTSPRLTAFLSPKRRASDAGSTSSIRTAILQSNQNQTLSPLQQPQGNHPIKRPSPLHLTQSPASIPQSLLDPDVAGSTTLDSSVHSGSGIGGGLSTSQHSSAFDPVNYTTSLVHSPQRASNLESRWIEHIGSTFEEDEVQKLWMVLVKYFDGRHALEGVAVREGLKKKVVSAVLAKFDAEGWLLKVRHW